MRTRPYLFKQTIEDFLKSDHSRASLSIGGMGPARAAEFDQKMRAVLEPYSLDGQLSYEVTARIVWGRPLMKG